MRYSTTSGMVLAALCVGEAVAGPAHAHAHLHKKAHEKKDVDWAALDWNDMGIDWSSAWAAGQHTSTSAAVVAATEAPVATTTAAAVVAATSSATSAQATTTSISGTSSSSLTTLWDDLVGLANDLTEFGSAVTTSSGSEVSYIGNIGSPQGSNMLKVDSRTGYDYTNEFINTSGETMTVVLWNKAYSKTGAVDDAEANLGSCVAPVTPILTFALAAGESQIVAFQENSQIGWAQAVSDIAESGAFATTWGEANFVSTGCGYDVSAIMNPNNNNYDMTITSTEAADCTSSRTENMWLTASDPVGNSDGSCYIAQGTATMTTQMGGTV
ncbi:uncharacterized protein LY89DRAFT_17710 [Mollisia scopiformis]|uniref:Allergen Asp f 4 n=1 Tax=Mollisia scopiformis TaxID=149040 RepID=A0A194XX18_MOLSC|nr:uncharacterized protein LY89DRAFT_17710 [Mollisia scopiformis]KUJ24322.1 hypothetical protein LY89DRAFT_17710 [Mollisia scopiformis]